MSQGKIDSMKSEGAPVTSVRSIRTRWALPAFTALAIVAGSTGTAHASIITYATPSTTAPANGMTSTYAGVTTIDFNSNTVGTQPAGFTPATGTVPGGGVVAAGGNSGIYAAPYGDTSQFYTVAYNPSNLPVAPASDTLALGATYNYFGFYWGSIDPYNNIEFYSGGLLVGIFTGTDFPPANSSQSSPYTNEYVDFDFTSGGYDTVVFSTSDRNFELDNIAYGNVSLTNGPLSVPEPMSLSLLGAAVIGLGMIRRRRQPAC